MKENKRDAFIDILRGIATVLVVVGHLPYTPTVVRAWIYTFHVPLFFLCSGLLFSPGRYSRFEDFLLSRVKGLLVPILALGLILRPLQVGLSRLLTLLPGTPEEYAIPFDPLRQLAKILLGDRGHDFYYSFWFLYALFLGEILFYFLVKLLKQRWYLYVVLIFAGIALQYLISSFVTGFYWSLDLLPASIAFLSAGYLYRITLYEKKLKLPVWLLPVFILLSFLFTWLNIRFMNGDQVNLFYGQLGNPGFYLITAFSGCGMSMIVADLLKTSRPLEFFGRNSLVTYAFQNTITIPLMMELLKSWGMGNSLFADPVFEWIAAVTGTLVLSVFISMFFNRFAPVLIGKKPRVIENKSREREPEITHTSEEEDRSEEQTPLESPVPGLIATIPETEEAVPEITETVPETEEAVPEIKETVPETEEAVPEITETVPETEEAVLEIKETVPETEEAVPEITETVPETEETVPEITETVSETEEAAPEKKEPVRNKTRKKVGAGILYGFTGLLVFLISLIGFSGLWVGTTWGDIDMDEIIFQLSQPLEGAGNGMVGDFILKVIVPTVLILAAYIVLMILLKKGKRRLICSCSFLLAALIGGFVTQQMLWMRLDLGNWLDGRFHESTFADEHYVDPATVNLEFPEEKRNLIYLYLESMEVTYADKASGGDWDTNLIPEITKLSMNSENFSGNEGILNGGIVLPGGSFTSGAIFGQTTGLPLKISIGGDFMDTQTTFFPKVTALGDILKEQGYRQMFLCGSDATFGGRRLFFTEHGDFEFRDLRYAWNTGLIEYPKMVFWGYEDKRLFQWAKDALDELSQGEEPFALTILTVDTHFEDGYYCELCRNEVPGDQYSNVMHCSSRQVDAFIKWLKQQDYYDNTTVIICGDHTTMDTDFCNDVDKDYQRKVYTAVVNSAAEPEDPGRWREFSTQDMFPTTLAAMGVTIPGNRLGLGTNLYSSEDTLVERYGTDLVSKELTRKSALLEDLEKVDELSNEELLAYYQRIFKDALKVRSYDPATKQAVIEFQHKTLGQTQADAMDGDVLVSSIEVEYQESGSDEVSSVVLKKEKGSDNCFTGTADLSSWDGVKGHFRVTLHMPDGSIYKEVDDRIFFGTDFLTIE